MTEFYNLLVLPEPRKPVMMVMGIMVMTTVIQTRGRGLILKNKQCKHAMAIFPARASRDSGTSLAIALVSASALAGSPSFE